MKQPEWVDRYVREVLKIEGKTKYPKIVFRKGRGGGVLTTSGNTFMVKEK